MQSMQQAIVARWLSVSGFSKYLSRHIFKIIFAKPGLRAPTFLILALPSFRSSWLYPMSTLSFSPICWSCSWASQDLVQPSTPWLLMNVAKASWMRCAMRGMCFLNAGHRIPAAWRDNTYSHIIKQFQEVLLVVIPSIRPSVSWTWSRTSCECTASYAPVFQPLTNDPYFSFDIGHVQAFNLIECLLYFLQCSISVHMVSNHWR